MNIKKFLMGIVTGTLLLGATVAPAFAASGYTFFGDANYISPGNASSRAVETISSSTLPGYGGVDFTIPSGITTVSNLNNLATDYRFIAGSCGGGAPRFAVSVTNGTIPGTGNIFVYIGPPPNYTLCPLNVWANTGNLITPASLVDTSQLPGGNFYDTYSSALAKYGSYTITDIALVTDAGWAVGGTQTVDFDNTMINSATITYEPNTPASINQCKDNGWQNVTDANGNPFKNQGDCVSYVQSNPNATGNKNK